jgi:hypothetical protein
VPERVGVQCITLRLQFNSPRGISQYDILGSADQASSAHCRPQDAERPGLRKCSRPGHPPGSPACAPRSGCATTWAVAWFGVMYGPPRGGRTRARREKDHRSRSARMAHRPTSDRPPAWIPCDPGCGAWSPGHAQPSVPRSGSWCGFERVGVADHRATGGTMPSCAVASGWSGFVTTSSRGTRN